MPLLKHIWVIIMVKKFNYLLDLIYPPKCIICNEILLPGVQIDICSECYKKVPFIGDKIICEICGQPLNITFGQNQCLDCRGQHYYFEKCIAPCEYKGVMRQAIVKFKFYGKRQYGKTLGKLMVERLNQVQTSMTYDMIIYTPMHRKRLMKRGYNQAKLLAAVIGKEINCPVGKDILLKIKDTSPQSILSRKQRLINLKNVFCLNPRADIKGKTLLLVDDVYTTGTTVNECAKLLKTAGAKQVFVATVAVGKGLN